MTIFEHFQENEDFVPSNCDEYFALQLARRFGEAENVRKYIVYTCRYSYEQLLIVYKNAIGDSTDEAATRFHSSFTQLEP